MHDQFYSYSVWYLVIRLLLRRIACLALTLSHPFFRVTYSIALLLVLLHTLFQSLNYDIVLVSILY